MRALEALGMGGRLPAGLEGPRAIHSLLSSLWTEGTDQRDASAIPPDDARRNLTEHHYYLNELRERHSAAPPLRCG